MATIPTKPGIGIDAALAPVTMSSWPAGLGAAGGVAPSQFAAARPGGQDALQALLAFSTLHQQVRHRRALASRRSGFEALTAPSEFEAGEQFVLDDVLQLVAERAVAVTGADGLAIALAENNEIVLRASAGSVRPDVGARIDRDSAFSGACFRKAEIIRCDDTESDDRVNREACRRLGARSMVAVPLCGRRRVIGLLEALSAEPFGFNDSDVRSLELLAELILGALKPQDEDRFAQSAELAAALLDTPPPVNEQAPVAPAPSLAAKPEPVIAPPPLASNALPAPAPLIEKVPELPVVAVEPQIAPAAEVQETPVPHFTFEQPAPSRRPGILIVLVMVVVGALVGAGLWWKLKSAQLGAAIVQPAPKADAPPPAAAPAPEATPQSAVAAAAVSPGANPNIDLNSNLAQEPALPPDTTQEPAKLTRVTGVRHWSSADSSTVVLDLEDQVQYESHSLSKPERTYFDLRDTSLAPEYAGKTIDIGDAFLSRIRVAQPTPGMTRIVLETRGGSRVAVSLEPNPYRLVIKVGKPGANPKADVSLFPGESEAAKNELPIVIPPPSREDLQLRARVPRMRIVVDAGHGGWDLGTVGRRGLLEKDLVLEIAQRLGKLLESRLGSEVILTRSDDNYISLDERAGVANQSQADLFVSVHANYSDLASARGVETYYTNLFSAPSSKDAETHDGRNTVTASLTRAELRERIDHSRRLAASVQRSLYGTLSAQNPGLRDRGIKEAGFVVLTETAMPGILAEVSFVSSPADEQKLRNDGYREQIAEALYRGIARYAASSRGVKVASAAK